MNDKKIDPFGLGVELGGIAALNACLSVIYLNEDGDKPTDETLGNALLAIEYHLERVAKDVIELEVPCKTDEAKAIKLIAEKGAQQ